MVAVWDATAAEASTDRRDPSPFYQGVRGEYFRLVVRTIDLGHGETAAPSIATTLADGVRVGRCCGET